MTVRVYIAGPMRGYKYYNFPAFDEARDRLVASGHTVISPADIDREHGFDPRNLPEDTDWYSIADGMSPLDEVVKRDINAVMNCDAIYLLKGWEKSAGAKAEAAVARFKGLMFIHECGAELHDSSVQPVYRAPAPGQASGTKLSNPKDIVGSTKPPLHYIPTAPLYEVGAALLHGALKYGAHNWRAVGVRSSVYYDALLRHLMSWWEGEDTDPDSGLPHLSHAIACLLIVRDCALKGNITDDRPIEAAHPYTHVKDAVSRLISECKNPAKPFLRDSQCLNSLVDSLS